MNLIMQNIVKQNGTASATNGALYTCNDFLIATREPAAFRTILEEQPGFDLATVDGVDGVQTLIWEMRVQFDAPSVQTGQLLDEYVAEQLKNQNSKSAAKACAWLLDSNNQYSPRKSVKVAREFVAQCEPAFEFSTDNELDDQLGSIEWEWSKYIPRGFVTGLVGEQDTGKSTVAQDFCRTLISGGNWPDGQPTNGNADKLLWIDTDGNLPLFHQRLKTWKMPRGRFIFPPDSLQELAIDNPENWRWIERAVEKFGIRLVVIDALSGSHNGKSNDEDSMKVIMKRLHAFAQKYKIAVVVLHHLNKAGAGVPAYPITIGRMRGSGAISQYCRSILALTTPDATQPNERRLDVIKLNIAKRPGPVGYILTDDGPMWGEAPEPAQQAQPHRAADDAEEFLRAELAGGAKAAHDVRDKAVAAGLSDYALKQARKKIGIEPEKNRVQNGGWLWSLPSENDEIEEVE